MSEPRVTRAGRLMRWGEALLAGGASMAITVQAQIAGQAQPSMGAALLRDAMAAQGLLDRQCAVPFTQPFGPVLLLAMLALAVALAWPARLWLLARMAALLRALPMEQGLLISAKAVGTVVLTTVLVAGAAQIALAGLDLTLPLLPEVRVLATSLAKAVGAAGLGMGVGRALRSHDDTSLRPMQLPSGIGSVIAFYPFLAGAMLGLTHFVDQGARVLNVASSSRVFAQSLIVVLEALLIIRFLILAGQAREREIQTAAKTRKRPVVPAIFGLTALGWGALALSGGAFLFGHTRFSTLVLQDMLWAALVLTIAWLLTGFIDALLGQMFDTEWTVGRFATAVVGLRRARVKQVTLLGSALLTTLVWLFAISLVAAPFYGAHAVVIEQITPGALMRSMESLHLSPPTLATALFVLIFGIVLTRIVRGWLEKRFLPSTSLDIGARTSIVTGLSYVGIIIALLGATKMLGLQLEKNTLIASALSVGVGFGLQSIIQNFVSGVIMLIERPVKPGDWVAVSGAEGTIRKIRVRATELVMADGGTVIVPNSSFISANVTNNADAMMCDRLDLSLTVTGSATPAQARDAILDMVKGCALVRSEPAPQIYLATLDEGQWGFSLRLYATHDTPAAQARSELLFRLGAQGADRGLKIKSA